MASGNTDEWLRAVTGTVSQPLWVIGPDGTVASINESAAKLLGYSDGRKLVGLASHDALHAHREDGSLYPRSECPIVQGVTSSRVVRDREVFLMRSGRPVHVSWKLAALPPPGYHLLAFSQERPLISIPERAIHRLPSASELREQIRREFRDPELTSRRLADDNYVSLRTLQGIFAREQDSPAANIRRARLEYGLSLVTDGARPGTVAVACGFRDPGTFARAFRRHYGVAPSFW